MSLLVLHGTRFPTAGCFFLWGGGQPEPGP